MLKRNQEGDRPWLHLLLVVGWLAIGLALRLWHLTLKPLWADEFSTIVFSLGHGYQDIPLNQWLTSDRLLAPMQMNPLGTVQSVTQRLFQESNHPPLYFVLTHFWLRLFSPEDGFVSLWGVRSLSAVAGALAIPAMYLLGKMASQSRLVGHWAAVLMAVSPFGVYLAQEARHYTLAVVWIILSLCCLAIAVRSLYSQTLISRRVVMAWIAVNGLGIATHYFVVLALMAEALVLLGVAIAMMRSLKGALSLTWQRIGVAIAGTLATGAIWLPEIIRSDSQNDELTRWIYQDGWAGLGLLSPLVQMVTSWLSMVILLPIQNVPQLVSRLSGAVLVAIAIMLAIALYHSIGKALQTNLRLAVLTLGGVWGGAIALFLILTYGVGIDLTQVFRYHFVYFPAVLGVIAASFAGLWAQPDHTPMRGLMVGIVIIGLVGSLSVASDMSFRKVHRPNRVAGAIAANSATNSEPLVAVAIAHQNHGQTGRLMGIAWALRSHSLVENPIFFLDHQDCTLESTSPCNSPGQALKDTLTQVSQQVSQSVDLWLLNYDGQPNLRPQGCRYDKTRRVDGYKYQLYHCPF